MRHVSASNALGSARRRNGGCYCTVVIEEGLRWVRVGEEHGA